MDRGSLSDDWDEYIWRAYSINIFFGHWKNIQYYENFHKY